MSDPEQTGWALERLGHSLSLRLVVTLVAAMAVIFALLGFLNIRLHRSHLEAATFVAAGRIGDVIKQGTSYHMMRNDREALYRMINDVSNEPGVERIRIMNQEGRISFSTDSSELNTMVDKSAEACNVCHDRPEPPTALTASQRFRIFRPNGHRVLATITPIENQPSCSSAACHAHPASQKILGVLDTHLSLARADAGLAESSRAMVGYTVVALALLSLLVVMLVWQMVHHPVRALEEGTQRLAHGELGYQIVVRSRDELGKLAQSFNQMSRQLHEARQEVEKWTQMLEARVEDKTRELKAAHSQILQAEKMASIGKLAATVAHEINNPLSGILTYAKLLKKWIERDWQDETRKQEIRSSLELIESESRRCGDIVKNLLMFSRSAPINLQWTDLNGVIERCLRLVQHQLELSAVQWEEQLDPGLPKVYCDGAQIEQLLLALVMNAMEAMPRGGNLSVRSRRAGDSAELQVRDDGMGIPEHLLPRLFEPFFTTKEGAHGVGLGLAIARGIVERHHGRIDVQSRPGSGTAFTILLPIAGSPALAETEAAPAAAVK